MVLYSPFYLYTYVYSPYGTEYINSTATKTSHIALLTH